jgi:hypothetical protein
LLVTKPTTARDDVPLVLALMRKILGQRRR